MEKNVTTQPNENLQVAKFDPAITYAGASTLQLSEQEMRALSAPFNDLDYEITPDGFIYLPQALSLVRLNTAIGVGRWSLLLINPGKEEVKDGLFKVYYDGALIIRNCFVARSCGEASYSLKNGKQSFATALEAAKSDCRQRCLKDLGVANDAWNPTFIRRWQKEHAIRVTVIKDNQRNVLWRRKDLDPFPYEVGQAPDRPTVPQAKTGQPAEHSELPWLNEGTPDYDGELKLLLEGKTISKVKEKFRISKKTEEQLITILSAEWQKRVNTCQTKEVLTDSYNANSAEILEYPWLKAMFLKRRDDILKPVKAA